MTLDTGTVLNNRYRIVRLLGQGGMGAVYRAWDTSLNKPCALKENLAASPDASRQFFREAQMLSTINHPSLPRVTDHFSISGQGQYLVMDFVEGDDLETIRQRQGVLSESQALPWITQVCDALGYLHQHVPPIIHRDIKPANIRITPQDQAILVDFGIAKTYDPKLATTSGARAVTPGYSPPEQYIQSGTTPRSDIYSLGATLYSLLTGVQLPDSINLLLAERQGIKPTTVQPPHLLRSDISLPTSVAIMKAIALDPEGRFATMQEFKQALTSPAPVSTIYPSVIPTAVATNPALEETLVVTPMRRQASRWRLGLIALPILVIILVVAWLWPKGDGGKTNEGAPEIILTATESIKIPPFTATVVQVATSTTAPTNTQAPTLESTPIHVVPTELIPSVTIPPPPQPTATAIPIPTKRTSARVLWDTSHGPRKSQTGEYYDPSGIYLMLSDMLAKQNITLVSGSISNLGGYDAVVIASVSSVDRAYSALEADKLAKFVADGGGLLIMGEQEGFSNQVQAVGDVFGVQFANPPELDGGCNQFASQSIFSGISQIHFYQGGSLQVSGMARGIAWFGGSIAIAEALPAGGRVIAIGDGAVFDNRIISEDNNAAFSINLFQWLTFMID